MADAQKKKKTGTNGIDALLADMTVEDLTALYREYRDDASPEGQRKFQLIQARMRRLPHDTIHPGEPYITCTIPLSVTGHPYEINGKKISGKVHIPKCEFDQIKYMEYNGLRNERERHEDRGTVRDLGQVGAAARQIQAEY